MNVERYLNQAIEAEHRIRDIQEQRSHLWAMVTRTTPALSGMPSAPSDGNRKEDGLAKLADLDTKLENEMTKLTEIIQDVDSTIQRVTNEKQRRLLHLRYLCGKSWRDIQRELGYSNGRSLYYTHKHAKRAVMTMLSETK